MVFPRFDVFLEFLRENNPPASTLVGVTSLAEPEFVEIEVWAAIE